MKIKKRNILLTAIIVIAIFSLGYFTYTQANEHLESLEQKIAQKQLDLELLLSDIENNKEYLEKWDSIKSFMDETIGSRRTAYGDFIITLETERNFDLQTTTEERAIPDNKQMQEIVFKLEFSSNITDLAEFLGRLDSEQDKLLQIKSLTINYRGKTIRNTTLTPERTDERDLAVTLVLAAPARIEQTQPETAVFSGSLLP